MTIPETTGTETKLVFPLRVLFEDEHLAVVFKPAGILISGNSFKTIANALPQNIGRSLLPDAARPQPVHRLDYPTTGALLVGKTSRSIRALNKLFREKQIQKTYYAVTIGQMEAHGEITSAIDGKPSHTDYQIRGSVPSKRFGQLNLVELNPRTGRRHQLRKHLAGIGNPILGDQEYGSEPLILTGKGLYLHAYSLRFIHPFTGEEVCFEAGLPQRFEKLFPDDFAAIFPDSVS